MPTAGPVEFCLPFENATLVGDRWTPRNPKGSALILHGAGTSSAEGLRELRTYLDVRGIETVAFDFVGHGRTGAEQAGTTLSARVQQAMAVLRSQALAPANLAVVGFSMGAYVALKVATAIDARRLCLAIPAAYAPEAFCVPFGPAFTAVLRAPRSWELSDAFALIREYAGHLLVLSAEHDQTIPSEIPHKYFSEAKRCVSCRHHVVAGAGHNLSAHYEKEPKAREAAYAEIATLCHRAL